MIPKRLGIMGDVVMEKSFQERREEIANHEQSESALRASLSRDVESIRKSFSSLLEDPDFQEWLMAFYRADKHVLRERMEKELASKRNEHIQAHVNAASGTQAFDSHATHMELRQDLARKMGVQQRTDDAVEPKTAGPNPASFESTVGACLGQSIANPATNTAPPVAEPPKPHALNPKQALGEAKAALERVIRLLGFVSRCAAAGSGSAKEAICSMEEATHALTRAQAIVPDDLLK